MQWADGAVPWPTAALCSSRVVSFLETEQRRTSYLRNRREPDWIDTKDKSSVLVEKHPWQEKHLQKVLLWAPA